MRQNIFNAGIAFLFSCFVFSCNESSFLEEKPLDFLSPENAYNTYADYETALTGLYAKVRANFYNSDFVFFQETDVAKNARDNNNFMGNLKAVSYTHLDVYKRQVWNTCKQLPLFW